MQAMHQAMMAHQRGGKCGGASSRCDAAAARGGAQGRCAERHAGEGGGGSSSSSGETLQRAAAETLDLLAELEKIGVYEPLNSIDDLGLGINVEKAADMGADRSRRLASLPSLAAVSIYEEAP